MGLIGSAYLLGCVIGAVLFSLLSMKLGRRRLFGATLMIYMVSTGLFSMATSMTQMCIARVMTGVGVGGEYTAIFSAIDELVPARYRGRVDIIVDGTWHLGSFVAYAVTLLFYNLELQSSSLWRYMFMVGSLGALPVLYLRQDIPESPRWLLHKGRLNEAQQVIQQIVSMNGGDMEGE